MKLGYKSNVFKCLFIFNLLIMCLVATEHVSTTYFLLFRFAQKIVNKPEK
jgi:hypothetical protein